MTILIDCKGCDGIGERTEWLSDDVDRIIPCADCNGDGRVVAMCRDCGVDPATIVCPDNHTRCLECAESVSNGARSLLALIASRSTDVTVDLLCQGALRLVHDIAR
jgi:hypothetical protein